MCWAGGDIGLYDSKKSGLISPYSVAINQQSSLVPETTVAIVTVASYYQKLYMYICIKIYIYIYVRHGETTKMMVLVVEGEGPCQSCQAVVNKRNCGCYQLPGSSALPAKGLSVPQNTRPLAGYPKKRKEPQKPSPGPQTCVNT